MKALTDVQGIGDATVRILTDHGIRSVKALAKIDIAQLTGIPGFGDKRAQAVIRAAMELAGVSKHPPSDKKKQHGKKKKHKKKEKGKKKKEKKAPKDKKSKNKKTKDKKGKGKKK